jgi:hypothetical protein
MTFGIVVEDQRDANVYSALIRRIRSDVESVVSRPCRGAAGVRQRFVGWLKNFEWHSGYQVGKALIIRDSDCGDPQSAEDELARILDQSRFQPTFPVHFYATRCEVETWLLADESAVNLVAQQRRKTATAQAVTGPLEGIRDAKESFRRMLSQARLPADPVVYAEVAAAADMDRIAQRCFYFRQFVECVNAC